MNVDERMDGWMGKWKSDGSIDITKASLEQRYWGRVQCRRVSRQKVADGRKWGSEWKIVAAINSFATASRIDQRMFHIYIHIHPYAYVHTWVQYSWSPLLVVCIGMDAGCCFPCDTHDPHSKRKAPRVFAFLSKLKYVLNPKANPPSRMHSTVCVNRTIWIAKQCSKRQRVDTENVGEEDLCWNTTEISYSWYFLWFFLK